MLRFVLFRSETGGGTQLFGRSDAALRKAVDGAVKEAWQYPHRDGEALLEWKEAISSP